MLMLRVWLDVYNRGAGVAANDKPMARAVAATTIRNCEKRVGILGGKYHDVWLCKRFGATHSVTRTLLE